MKSFGKILSLVITFSLSTSIYASNSCAGKLTNLLETSENAAHVDGRESELRIQLEKDNIKSEKIDEIKGRIALLQSVRLKKQGEISDLFEDFQENCIKNK